MLRMSRKIVLALEAVLDIAYNGRPHPVQSKDITERQGIPQRYLEQVLQQLVRSGILKGVRGPRGGYTLARERRRITLGDVLRVVNQMENDEDSTVSRAELGEQIINPIWDAMQDDILKQYDAITMEDLCRDAEAKGIKRADEESVSFTI